MEMRLKYSSPLAGEDGGEGELGKAESRSDKKMIKTNISRAKDLRKTSTEAEKKIWNELRRHRLSGKKFRRQQPIGNYIVDFVCFEKQVIIEIDGGQHFKNVQKDHKRDDWLRTQGYIVLRFWNNDVIRNIEAVLEAIRSYL